MSKERQPKGAEGTRVRHNLSKRHNGFTLIEILLVLSILMGVGVMEMQRDTAKAKSAAAEGAGKQLALVGSALEKYLAEHMPELQAMNDPNCSATGNLCTLDIPALVSSGYLPNDFTNTVLFGGSYVAVVRRIEPPLPSQASTICGANPAPIGCPVPYDATSPGSAPLWQWGLQGLVYTSDPWKTGSTVERALMGQAVRAAGPLAGISESGTANGLAGGWSVSSTDFGSGLDDGQLVYLTGSQINLWSQFLRRDGTLPMMGNLDMGSYNVNKMTDLFLNGPPTNPRNKNISSLMPNWVFKGVMSAKSGAFVPEPMCENGGVPRIKVMMQLMQGSKAGLYFENTGSATGPFTFGSGLSSSGILNAANAQLAANASQHGYQSWADPTSGGWRVYFQEFFSQDDATTGKYCAGDGTQNPCEPMIVKGEGLAELYCNYPDQ